MRWTRHSLTNTVERGPTALTLRRSSCTTTCTSRPNNCIRRWTPAFGWASVGSNAARSKSSTAQDGRAQLLGGGGGVAELADDDARRVVGQVDRLGQARAGGQRAYGRGRWRKM